ncbi:MAG TPA: hypothetical protein VLJ21_01225 [Candidatus Binatia bacterium]|nr:hypothetical protein [Candidatus Binatia bacterium]
MDWNVKVSYERKETVSALRALLTSYGFAVDDRKRMFQEPVLYATAPRNLSATQLSELERTLDLIPGTKLRLQNDYRATQHF